MNPYRAIAAAVAASCLAACSGFEVRDPSTWVPRAAYRSQAAVPPAAGAAAAGESAGLDARARGLAADALTRALDAPAGAKAVDWSTEDGAASGRVAPGTPFVSGSRTCRDFESSVHADGRTTGTRGVACRAADGTWQRT